MFKKLLKLYKKYIVYGTRSTPILKQSSLDKDIVLGCLQKRICTNNLKVGVKVVTTAAGIANVLELKSKGWVVVSYKQHRRIAEHHISKLYQYFVEVKDRTNDIISLYPLSYADYEYIHPDEDNNVWFEGHITKLRYFQLIDEVKEEPERKLLPYFNSSRTGKNILEKLREDDIEITIKSKTK